MLACILADLEKLSQLNISERLDQLLKAIHEITRNFTKKLSGAWCHF